MTIPLGFSQLNLIFTGVNMPAGGQTTFGVDNTALALPPAAVAALVIARWTTDLRGQTMDGYTLSTVHCKNGDDATGPFSDTAVGLAGSQSGSEVNPQCTFLINKLTAHGGRHGRGRFFYPALGTTFVNQDGTLATGVAAASTTAFTTFLNHLTTDQIPMVLLHRDLTTPYVVTGVSCESRLATQRRRMRR